MDLALKARLQYCCNQIARVHEHLDAAFVKMQPFTPRDLFTQNDTEGRVQIFCELAVTVAQRLHRDLANARAQLATAETSRNHWQEMAAQLGRNQDFSWMLAEVVTDKNAPLEWQIRELIERLKEARAQRDLHRAARVSAENRLRRIEHELKY